MGQRVINQEEFDKIIKSPDFKKAKTIPTAPLLDEQNLEIVRKMNKGFVGVYKGSEIYIEKNGEITIDEDTWTGGEEPEDIVRRDFGCAIPATCNSISKSSLPPPFFMASIEYSILTRFGALPLYVITHGPGT